MFKDLRHLKNIMTKVLGKSIPIVKSAMLDPTPKGIHWTKVKQKEIGWVGDSNLVFIYEAEI